MGKGTKRVRGGRTFSDTSRRSERHTVGIPLFSMTLAISPTDWLQIGHTGTRKYCIYLILPQLGCNLRSRLRDQPFRSRDRPHEAEVPMVQGAGLTTVHQLTKSVQRKNQVPVSESSCLIER